MSYGDIRIWQGEVTSYWGWELSVDGNPEGGRKIGGWASSRERAFSDAMTQLRLDGVRMGLHLDEDRTPPPLESRHRLNSALNELEAAERRVVELEVIVQRQAEQIGGLTNLLACDDDCYHAPMCVRWEHGDDVFDDDYHNTLRDETGAKWPNDPNIT